MKIILGIVVSLLIGFLLGVFHTVYVVEKYYHLKQK